MTTHTSSSVTKSFPIHSISVPKCLTARLQSSEYHDNAPVNALYSVLLTDCNPEYPSQLWHWGDHDWLIHSSTGLCLTSTTSNRAVLLGCSKRDWRQRWLCNGQAIEQLHSGMQLTVISSSSSISRGNTFESTTAQLPSNYEESYIEKLEKILEGESRRDWKLTLESKNYRSQQQLWSTYDADNKYTDICSQSLRAHRVSECYYQGVEGVQEGWLRCDVHGYLVAGIEYSSSQLSSLSRLLCCAPASSYKHKEERTDLFLPTEPSLCEHRHWWVAALGEVERFACEEGSFLKGLKISQRTARISAVLGECCWPGYSDQCYTHCYKETMKMDPHAKAPINSCHRRGFHITSIEKTDCSQLDCTHEIQCCL